MANEFEHSVLAIVNAESTELLGTCFVISSQCVLTCTHIFPELRISSDGATQLPPEIVVLAGDRSFSPSCIYVSRPLDVTCMHFTELPGLVPIPLVRSTELKTTSLTAVGFAHDAKGASRRVANSQEVIHELKSDGQGFIQFCQLGGGAPQGFSGGPVLVPADIGWWAVGMLQLGQESAPTSRFIAMDPVAAFLSEHRLSVAVGEFRPKPAAAPDRPSESYTGNIIANYGDIDHGSTVHNIQTITKKAD
jgi:Trypsin-like peptidase domain